MTRSSGFRNLLDLARAGDRAAFERLLAIAESAVKARVRALLGGKLAGRMEAADILQDVRLKAHRSIHRFRGENEATFSRWMVVIAERVILNHARRPIRERPLDEESGLAARGVSPSRAARREERLSRLESSLASLSQAHREVIRLAKIERLTMKEIGERLGRSTHAASQLLYRALKALREAFGDTESLNLPPRGLEEPEGD
jgi:RNA polymerase sigma-70 factor (ECF subfamily)